LLGRKGSVSVIIQEHPSSRMHQVTSLKKVGIISGYEARAEKLGDM